MVKSQSSAIIFLFKSSKTISEETRGQSVEAVSVQGCIRPIHGRGEQMAGQREDLPDSLGEQDQEDREPLRQRRVFILHFPQMGPLNQHRHFRIHAPFRHHS